MTIQVEVTSPWEEAAAFYYYHHHSPLLDLKHLLYWEGQREGQREGQNSTNLPWTRATELVGERWGHCNAPQAMGEPGLSPEISPSPFPQPILGPEAPTTSLVGNQSCIRPIWFSVAAGDLLPTRVWHRTSSLISGSSAGLGLSEDDSKWKGLEGSANAVWMLSK